MTKIISLTLLVILFSCGGGGGTSSVASSQSPQASTQPATITFKNVPESLSMIE